MTLLGKLFRPWDLPQETNSSEELPTQPHPVPKVASSSSSSPTIPPASCALLNKNKSLILTRRKAQKSRHLQSLGGSKDALKSSHDPRRKEKCASDPIPGRVPADDHHHGHDNRVGDHDGRRQCGGGSECSNDPWPQCSTDCSPSTTNLCESSQSPLFLHSSAINNLANLSRSELTAMGLLPPDLPSSHKAKRQRPKRFHCPHCQVAFSNNGQLRGHIRIHTGERPFSCEHEGCGKSFTRNEELTRHRRIHSGLRPFPCTYCGKKFGRKDHLKKHTRTHQRPLMFNHGGGGGMIGFSAGGNPFLHPFNINMGTDFGAATHQPSYGLPFVLNMPPPSSHFHFS